MNPNFDEPTISSKRLIEFADEHLSASEAKQVLAELGIDYYNKTANARVTVLLQQADLGRIQTGIINTIRYLYDNRHQVRHVEVQELPGTLEDQHIDKARVLEVAQKYRRQFNWCSDGFQDALRELGIKLPPQRVYRVSFDILEDDVLDFSKAGNLESFSLGSAFDYLDETEIDEVRGFHFEPTDRFEFFNKGIEGRDNNGV